MIEKMLLAAFDALPVCKVNRGRTFIYEPFRKPVSASELSLPEANEYALFLQSTNPTVTNHVPDAMTYSAQVSQPIARRSALTNFKSSAGALPASHHSSESTMFRTVSSVQEINKTYSAQGSLLDWKLRQAPLQTHPMHRISKSIFAMIFVTCLVFMANAAFAQNAVLNDGSYATNTGLQANNTASVSILNAGTDGMGGAYNDATFSFGAQVTGSAIWNGGVQFQSQSGVEQIWTQPRNTAFGTSNGNYQMNFSRPVSGLTFYHGGLDNADTVNVTAFNDGTPVALPTGYFSDFTGGVNIQSSGTNFVELIGPSGGSGDERQREYKVTFPSSVFVDELRFETAKPASPGDVNTVTLAFYLFDWDPFPPIDAINDAPAAVNSATGATISNVVANDTFDSATDPAIDTVVIINEAGTAADGMTTLGLNLTPTSGSIILDPDTGEVTVAPNTTAGTYVYTYEICDVVNSTNCDTATVTVVVEPAPIDAINDAPAAVDGLAGATIPNVVANDTFNSVQNPAIDTVVTINESGTAADGLTTLGLDMSPASGGITLDPDTGEVTVAPNTTAGTYVYTYEICDVVNPTNCDTATVTVVVDAAPIDAIDDAPVNVDSTTGATLPNVVANDNFDGNTNPSIGTDVTVKETGTSADGSTALGLDMIPASGSITLNPLTGEISVAANTTAGTYVYTYEICDVVNPTNCDTATATVVVDPAPIDAIDDTPANVDSVAGATIPNVVANDTFNGTVNPAIGTVVTVNEAGTAADGSTVLGLDTTPTAGSITLDPNTGEVTVAPNTTMGTYVYTYEICDVVNPTSCDTATVTIVVDPAPIDAIDDAPVAVDNTAGGTVPNVVANDTFNGALNPTIGSVVTVNAVGTAADGTTMLGLDMTPSSGSITLDPNTGEITVAPDTTVGIYNYTYEICDVVNPTNCDTAIVAVNVGSPPVATNDAMVPTEPGPVSIDPLSNDDGVSPLDPTSVVLTGTNAPSGSTLSMDGKTLTVPNEGEWTVNPTTGVVTFTPAAGFSGAPTPAAYTVSDVLGRASNEAVLSVTILSPLEITATNDGPISLDGTSGDTSALSILTNDTLNGAAISDPTLVTLTTVSVPTLASGSISLDPAGTVTVGPGTTSGTYTVVYQICEATNPTNCATAEVTVVVVDTGDGLITEIEEDLVAILEDDFVSTLTTQSSQISGYSANALDRLRGRGHDRCLAEVNALLQVENILFDTDKAIIKPASHKILDEIAEILRGCPSSSFEIAGHTDSDASDAYNIDLSQRRVVAVLNALSQRGVDTAGYTARGYGESQPIASNATEAGKAQNRRVEFRPLGLTDGYNGPCEDSFSLVRSLDAQIDGEGATADGRFFSDQHECITDRREVFEGSLSYVDTNNGQTQSAINLSYRREQYRGSDSVFGYFVGLYGSKSEVTRRANGEINGVGLNAGIYGANRLDGDLFLDYYLGAAAGRHTFDLAFDRDIGTIDATGNYQYFAGFAGAALSGEVDLGDTTLTPRIGFDYIYTPGADVDVVAELSGLSEAGDLELQAMSGGRIFAEIRSDHLLEDGASNLWINPRVACYQSLGALDGACGFGGSIGIESVGDDRDLTYAFELDGEWGDDYSRGSISISAARNLGVGVLSGDASINSNGAAVIGGAYEVSF